MTDIVARLRARTSELAHEAADEIERLAKRVAKLERDIARARVRAEADAARHNAPDPDVGGFRVDDPETSVDAAYSINVEHLKYAIMTVLRDAGSPLNCSEIGERLELPRDTISPRFPSLRAARLVEPHGLRPGPSNRDQTSYVLTDRGRQAVTQRAIT